MNDDKLLDSQEPKIPVAKIPKFLVMKPKGKEDILAFKRSQINSFWMVLF